ncbi:ABC transporter substrate-binding protein [Catellatospora sp. TT07R-123]|uniref:ABC transporter substrate-binding protein n=1 Tax=Catellatospora sp. TT07R-123 TaxID=2733863 RepID=UPI001B0526A5|nr:ABC transporter substrate-binding protein [Catellatospora sp. TT07R-123]GHJ50577.1 ABC transporter substrate-binding protein [Catellatospora sp. TT07R-123]
MFQHRFRRRALGALAAAGLVAALAACATTEDPAATPSPSSAAAAYPVTVGSVTLPAQPVKIVSLSPTATEMLYAVGAGGQVTAVDDQSNFPAGVPKTDLSGFQPNAEAIAAKSPDLVVLSGDANNVVAQLTALKIPVFLAPAAVTLEDSYAQLKDLGKLTGHADQAAAVAQQMKDDIAKLVKDLPQRSKPLTYYYELDPTLYSVTSKTFIGSLFTLAGLTNVADAADTKGTGYPQLTAESLVKSNPDLIFLADTKCCTQNADTVKARAGWSTITAVTKNQVVALDDDIASRWGPRIVDLIRAITTATATIPAA